LPHEGKSVVEILMSHIHKEAQSVGEARKEAVDETLEKLIARAMAKDPADRHGTAAAFRYELNTVMDMLDMGRRKARGSGTIAVDGSREGMIMQAFDRSRLPQAMMSVDGVIAFANRAFAKLVGHDWQKPMEGIPLEDTALNTFVPGLMRAARSVHTSGKPTERKAKVYRGADKPPLELVVWLTPLPIADFELHLIVRVVEVK
jgi:hypothetical protein